MKTSDSQRKVLRLAEQALNAGLSERLTNRLLEVIRERRTVTQDNVEAEQDLTEATKESQKLAEETALNLQYVNELKAEGVDVEKVLQKLEDERLQMTIENLRTQIALLDEGSEKRIELEKQLSDALLEEQQRRLDAEAEAEEKALERRQEIQEAAASTLEKFAEKRHEKRMNRIEEELEAEQKRADELRELARQGIQDAENNLAENQKRIAELERQREKELKRQKQFELALAAARAYSANVAAGEKNPLAKTITDVTLLEAFVESLTGFYHGTEDTGNKGVIADEYGVITGYTHANERVLTASQNAMIPDSVSNWDLARMAQNFGQPEQPSTSENILISGLKEVKNAIEKKPSYIGREYDATERAVIDSYQEKGRLLRRHYKRSGLISKRR
jgi:chromosome segregation ATPase